MFAPTKTKKRVCGIFLSKKYHSSKKELWYDCANIMKSLVFLFRKNFISANV